MKKQKVFSLTLLELIGGMHPLNMALKKDNWNSDSIDSVLRAVRSYDALLNQTIQCYHYIHDLQKDFDLKDSGILENLKGLINAASEREVKL